MLRPIWTLLRTSRQVAGDLIALIPSAMRSRAQLAAENLFLRKQLVLYLERQVKPRRADDATRITLVTLSSFIDWRRGRPVAVGVPNGVRQTSHTGAEAPPTVPNAARRMTARS